jgi:hypothetical protein
MELLNKITLKGMDTQPKPGSVKNAVALVRIFGRSQGYKVKTSDYGESLAFTGTFEAIRLADGAVFRAPKVFLPKQIEGLLGSAHDNTEGEPIDFAVEVGVKPAKNAYGYEWTVKPLFESKGPADQLAHLRESVMTELAIGHDSSDTAPGAASEGTSKKDAKK